MKTRNYEWVISGSSAMNALFQHGYLVVKKQTKYGVRWVYMMKECDA